MKYGVLISLTGGEYRQEDIRIGLLLFSFIPAHLFIGYLIELLAATRARDALRESRKAGKAGQDPKLRPMWTIIAAAHTVNATASLGIASYLVYNKIFHPLIGTMCEIHVVIVWLKQLSYAFTNRDLRDAYLSSAPVPDIYRTCLYPSNITIPNLIYFWWAPTLVYQPVYPRTPTFRPSFFFKRLTETILLSIAIWFLSQQYAVPTLRNSLDAVSALNLPIILQRLMKLSTISLVIWLIGFFALFHSFLNALSELLRFGDRDFYGPWWNSASLGTYWKLWNKPVYNFMRRHVYAPMQARGFSPAVSSMMVFTFSAVLHEVLVGIPTHSVTGVAFAGMMFQIPLIWCTMPLERMRGSGSVLGNVVFWVSFCLVGQPVAALLYYFSWQVKYGGVRA
ncbi:hypothetical protein EX30DRAFT_230952 [Ascodesmis nigricans]|uniref:diacylglycerol O-acyltransferase n=1 Tax=Ascodesmis nigricans TaxID=341454 RepID=A0A4S2MQ92_9PEZI|nr:hypothetical protein EX30DRAFT_230952 [Ascodesmis nigricans]